MKMVQELLVEDYPIRKAFAIDMLRRINGDPSFLMLGFFFDEAHFNRHGGVNTHNYR